MVEGIDISEKEFSQLSLKKQNVVLFKNILDIKNDMSKTVRMSTRAALYGYAALGLTVFVLGFLIEHLLKK
jgi:hypothetical protein